MGLEAPSHVQITFHDHCLPGAESIGRPPPGHNRRVRRLEADGCAAAEEPAGRPRLQIWTRERSYALYELRVTDEEISGIPLIDDRHCRECRVAIKRADIDSIQVGDPARGTATTLAVAGTAVLGFMGVMLLLYRIGAFGAD